MSSECDDIPTLQTYGDVLRDLVGHVPQANLLKGKYLWSTNGCEVFAEPIWLGHAIFFFVIITSLLYTLVVILIISQRNIVCSSYWSERLRVPSIFARWSCTSVTLWCSFRPFEVCLEEGNLLQKPPCKLAFSVLTLNDNSPGKPSAHFR